MLDKQFWETKHKESYGRYHKVTEFARFCYYNFMKDKKGKLLDLCCGKGADSIFFHNKGFIVTGMDYSSEGIKQFNETQKRYDIFLTALVKDITEPMQFEADSFNFVYSRAGLYYFTDEELKKTLSEVSRVMKSEGLLMFQVKSVNDKDYGKGKELEKDMYEDESGYVRHYFSKDYVEELLKDFHIVINEERNIPNGSAYLEVVAEKK
ncbi:class I SAM-dependent methyltransferase [Candidatus Woesearchaeota archaeon]|nr:class I SAM-dependent methyltransferase [Candidatus Woesearchaeota archaeon]